MLQLRQLQLVVQLARVGTGSMMVALQMQQRIAKEQQQQQPQRMRRLQKSGACSNDPSSDA
jgi:hypothetical protein